MNWPWLPWAQKSLAGLVPGRVHQQRLSLTKVPVPTRR
jgi:hypothetical protein